MKTKVTAAGYDGTDFSVISASREGDDNLIEFNVDTGKVGSYLKIRYSSNDFGLNAGQIWFQPLDMLKVSVGTNTVSLNNEQIGWWRNILRGTEGLGVQADLNVGALSFTLGAAPGVENPLFTTKDDGTFNGNLYGRVAYGDSWGTVQAVVSYKDAYVNWLEDCFGIWGDYGSGYQKVVWDNFAKHDLGFGVGYNGSTGPLTYFADFAGYTDKDSDDKVEFSMVAFDAYAKYAGDGFTVHLYVPAFIRLNAEDDATTAHKVIVSTLAKFEYPISAYTCYLQFRANNWLGGDDLALAITPGISGTFADKLNWTVEFAANVAPSAESVFTFSLPVYFSVYF